MHEILRIVFFLFARSDRVLGAASREQRCPASRDAKDELAKSIVVARHDRSFPCDNLGSTVC